MYPVYLINSMFDKLPDKYMLFCYDFCISVFSNFSPSKSFTLIGDMNKKMLTCIKLLKLSEFRIDVTAMPSINALF